MSALNIHVKDTQYVFDSLPQAIFHVQKIIEEWFASDSTIPLTITLTKVDNKGPPTLKVNVNFLMENTTLR